MLKIDYSVIEDWFISHKSLSIIMLCAVIIILSYGFILYQPWLQYRSATQGIALMQKQLSVLQQSIEQDKALKNAQLVKIKQLEMHRDSAELKLPPALWLNHHVGQCKISHYIFSNDNSVPPGGQGRPTFNLAMQLNYAQALCMLSHFALYSSGWELSKMTMNSGDENNLLEMIFSGSLL
jgi:hypothetical protein